VSDLPVVHLGLYGKCDAAVFTLRLILSSQWDKKDNKTQNLWLVHFLVLLRLYSAGDQSFLRGTCRATLGAASA